MEKLTRRHFLSTAAKAAAAIGLTGCGGKPITAPRFASGRPNIIFLLTDDQRWDTMGCAGNKIIHTPNMDSLAAEGVRFTNAFVTTSICTASRASIFNGTYQRIHRYNFGTPPLSAEMTDISYPTLLKVAGYRTGLIGKFGVTVETGETARMFDYFEKLVCPYLKNQPDGSARHLTNIMGDKTIEFLDTCTATEPFCLSVGFQAPHAEDDNPDQYVWPKQCDHLYRNVTIPTPVNSSAQFFNAQPRFLRESLNRKRWYWRFDTPRKAQEMTKGYYRMISGIDMVIGRIIEELKKRQIYDNTVIMLMGDNGYFLGERGFAGKWLMHEESIRVPLIVFDPRANRKNRGLTNPEFALNVDVAPTILELAKVKIPPKIQGRSLVPLLKGRKTKWRKDFLYEYLWFKDDIPKCEGVRTQRWKYIRYFRQQPLYEELYDLAKDPHETLNLANDRKYQQTLKFLRRRCDHLIDKAKGR